MNTDLKKILLEMPKSIIIYDKKQEIPVLANIEFKKLLGCPLLGDSSFDNQVCSRIKEKIFSPID